MKLLGSITGYCNFTFTDFFGSLYCYFAISLLYVPMCFASCSVCAVFEGCTGGNDWMHGCVEVTLLVSPVAHFYCSLSFETMLTSSTCFPLSSHPLLLWRAFSYSKNLVFRF